MADFRPFSLAEAAQGAGAIQAVQQNALAMAAARDKQARLSPLMAAAAGGDQAAAREVVGIDPELGNQILTATSKMDDNQRTQFKHSVETKGSVLQAVMNVPDVYKDQAWESAKAELVGALGPDAVKGMPERFDPNWTQMNIDKAMSVSDLLSARGTAFQPTPAYDEAGNLVFMQGTNVPGKAPTVIKGLRPIDKVEQAVNIEEGKSEVQAKYGAEIEGGKAAGKAAIEQSGKAIESLTAVRKNMTNIDEAIAAIDSGAESGVIASRMPSVKAASVELDNIRSRMGLDVISGTTFGALSEGELKFALDSAIPKNLQPADLKAWLVKKKDAQQKLARELENAAIYLGKPGNTPAGYLEFMRNSQPAAPPPAATSAQTGTSKYTIKVKN